MTAFSTPNDIATLASPTPRQQELERVMQTAIDHHHRLEYTQAAALYASVIDAERDHADAHYHLGVLRMQTGAPAEAVEHFEAALGQAPNFAQLWVYYINALTQSGQKDAARAALDVAQQRGLPRDAANTLRARVDGEPEAAAPSVAAQGAAAVATETIETGETIDAADATDAPPATAAAAKPDARRPSAKELKQYSDLFNSGNHAAAAKVARRLTKRYPSHGECWFALAHVLQHTGEYAESTRAAERAATLLPDDLRAQLLFANRLAMTREYRRAEQLCRELLAKHPDHAALHRVLGAAVQGTGREAEGIAAFRRAVELAPNDALEIDALANALLQHGLFDEAEAAFRQALALAPLQAATHSNLLFCLMHKPDLDAASAFEEFREFGRRHETPAAARGRHANDRNPSRRLKIGFVSGDLLNHPVAYFLLSVVEQLARDPGLSLQIYSNYAVTDGFTEMIRQHAHGWHTVFGMTDAAFAKKIRDDRIDILVDLSGHTGRNRLVAFAQKPAPVQVSWIGNPATTGLTTVDYYLSDRFFTPLAEFAGRFTEKLVFLPALAPFKPHPEAPDVNELPALKNGYLTFGSFSRMVKIGPEVVSLWARVLHEVPNSRLLIGAISSNEQMTRLALQLVDKGIDPSRISFAQRGNTTTYLQQHHLVDVCLDAFPFAGSTTTMHALWMGVPTITLPGDSMASRGSTGWLLHLGLDEAFVARDKDDYVRKCQALAADLGALATVRRELRAHCMNSPIVSASTIANAASRAFRTMWQRWCEGLAPEHFEVLAEPGDAPAAAAVPADEEQEPQRALAGEFADTLTVLLDKQHFAEAEAVARQFVALLPEAGTGWRLLATSLRAQGKFAEALDPLRRAYSLLPGDRTLQQELTRLSQYVSDLQRIAPLDAARPATDLIALRTGSRQFRHPVGALTANVPVLIPAFNNVTYLRRMVAQLQARGLRNVIVVDNASTAPAMLDYLDSIQDAVSVVRLEHNVGPRAITLADAVYRWLPDIFCITDPDLELNPELPDTFLLDLIDTTETLRIGKAGFALDISQPELMDEKVLAVTQSDGVNTYNLIEWESRFWQHRIGTTAGGDPIFQAPIDTTFAVYNKRYFRRETHLAAVRFGGRYTCRHLPWYKDNGLEAAEDQYYRERQEWSTFMKGNPSRESAGGR